MVRSSLELLEIWCTPMTFPILQPSRLAPPVKAQPNSTQSVSPRGSRIIRLVRSLLLFGVYADMSSRKCRLGKLSRSCLLEITDLGQFM